VANPGGMASLALRKRVLRTAQRIPEDLEGERSPGRTVFQYRRARANADPELLRGCLFGDEPTHSEDASDAGTQQGRSAQAMVVLGSCNPATRRLVVLEGLRSGVPAGAGFTLTGRPH
jgi:hypothetical protein